MRTSRSLLSGVALLTLSLAVLPGPGMAESGISATVPQESALTGRDGVPVAGVRSIANRVLAARSSSNRVSTDLENLPVSLVTTSMSKHNHHGFSDIAVQAGDAFVVKTVIMIPPGKVVNNPTLLTTISGPNINRESATVSVECANLTMAGGCDSKSLLQGEDSKFGVVIGSGAIQNTTSDPIAITVTISDLVFVRGGQSVSIQSELYIGDLEPQDINGISNLTKGASAQPTNLLVRWPDAEMSMELQDRQGVPIVTPIDPGTPVQLRATISNKTPSSKLYNVGVKNIKQALDKVGLKISSSFDESQLVTNVLEHGIPFSVTIPLDWDKSKYTGDNRKIGTSIMTIPYGGDTGPLNVYDKAKSPETTGVAIANAKSIEYSVQYPDPMVGVTAATADGKTLGNDDQMVLNGGMTAHVTFKPVVNHGKGHNAVLCVKASNTDADMAKPPALGELSLLSSLNGVTKAEQVTACAAGETQIDLPSAGTSGAYPEVTISVPAQKVDMLTHTQVTGTLKVDSLISRTDDNTAGERPFTTAATQLLDIGPWADGKVSVSFEQQRVNNDEDPKPTIRISNVDGTMAIPENTQLNVTVPAEAMVADSADVTGCRQDNGQPGNWTCQVTTPIQVGQSIAGPTITNLMGPRKTIRVELLFPNDSDQTNNVNSATSQPKVVPIVPGPPKHPAPEPAPTPEPVPTPTPMPSNRPRNIPPAPKPPAIPAPVIAGHTPVQKDATDRAASWVESVVTPQTKTPVVLIGRDNVFADSLASGGLQGLLDAPLLLNPVNSLSTKTKESLQRLKPERVIVLGGLDAQSANVEAELKAMGWQVSRVAGATRIETAIDVAKSHAPKATEGVLARAYASNGGSGSQAFADALGGGAYAARKEVPVFLTESGTLTPSLKAYLASSSIKHLTIIGSTEAVSQDVESALHKIGIKTTRISGQNRAQTAVGMANALGYWHAGEAQSVLVVDGESDTAWTDAFPAALYAKRFEVPLVLSGKEALLPETKAWVAPGLEGRNKTRVICGYSVGSVKECGYTPGVQHTK